MALNATIGGSTSNSYVTEAEASNYFADSLQGDSWTGLTAKEAALVSSTRYLDMLDWEGQKTDESQSLELPREYMYDINSELVGNDVIPEKVKQAVYELALYMGSNPDSFSTADTTTKIKVDVIEIEQEVIEFGSYSSLPLRVRNLISPYMASPAVSGNGFCLELQ